MPATSLQCEFVVPMLFLEPAYMVPVDSRFRPGHCRPGWCGLGDGRPSLDCGSGQASRRRVSSSLASGAQVSGEVDADGCFLSTERELRWQNAARLQNVQRVLRCDGVLGDAADLSLLRSTLGACIYGACVFSPRSAALATVDAACRSCGVLTAMTEQQELRYPGRVGCICGVRACHILRSSFLEPACAVEPAWCVSSSGGC